MDFKISCNSNDKLYSLSISDIYYVETVERKTFIYTEKEIYLSDKKLYELEQMLSETSMIRISKSCLMNMEMFFCGCLATYCIFSSKFKKEFNDLISEQLLTDER